MSCIDAGATACRFLVWHGMRRAIGPEKEFSVAASGRFHQFPSMNFTFQHGKTVVVWAYSPLEKGVAVEKQVMSSDRGGNIVRRLQHELHRLASGNVLEYDAQLRKPLCEGNQHPFEKS